MSTGIASLLTGANMDKDRPNRIQSLDLLRVSAVMLVVFRHMIDPPAGVTLFLAAPLLFLKRMGWVGVDILFVLSGFLIGGAFFREYTWTGTLHVKRFLVRRELRIIPPFLLLILVSMMLMKCQGQFPGRASIAGEFLFLQNYIGWIWGHTWALGVEQHFYILFALLIYGLIKWCSGSGAPFRIIPWVAGALSVACLGIRIVVSGLPFSWLTHLCPTHLRIDSLFAGVLLAYFANQYGVVFRKFAASYRIMLIAAGILAFIPACIWTLETSRFLYTWGFTLQYLGAACLVAVFSQMHASIPFGKWIVFAGSLSYSVYLWHMPMAFLCKRLFLDGDGCSVERWMIYVAAYLSAAVFGGILAGLAIERPVGNLRRRIFPRFDD